LGLEPFVGRHVLGRAHGYLAAEDRQRAADIEDAWLDPDIHAVLCARGGYGSARLLEIVDWAKLATAGRSPKPFVGSSDVTVLHQAFALHLGIRTFYGPAVAGSILGEPDPCPRTVDSLAAALFRPEEPVELAGGNCLVPGVAGGVLSGGTLTMICSMAGSPEFRSAAGAIVVLEDVRESPYKIDRMLTQLIRSGWFDGVRAVACGSWTACGTVEQVNGVLLERLAGLKVPVVTGLDFGHGTTQLTVPLGRHAELDATSGVLRAM
jgi:muramoyltetrapeptide carboxypeptidase